MISSSIIKMRNFKSRRFLCCLSLIVALSRLLGKIHYNFLPPAKINFSSLFSFWLSVVDSCRVCVSPTLKSSRWGQTARHIAARLINVCFVSWKFPDVPLKKTNSRRPHYFNCWEGLASSISSRFVSAFCLFLKIKDQKFRQKKLSDFGRGSHKWDFPSFRWFNEKWLNPPDNENSFRKWCLLGGERRKRQIFNKIRISPSQSTQLERLARQGSAACSAAVVESFISPLLSFRWTSTNECALACSLWSRQKAWSENCRLHFHNCTCNIPDSFEW